MGGHVKPCNKTANGQDSSTFYPSMSSGTGIIAWGNLGGIYGGLESPEPDYYKGQMYY